MSWLYREYGQVDLGDATGVNPEADLVDKVLATA